ADSSRIAHPWVDGTTGASPERCALQVAIGRRCGPGKNRRVDLAGVRGAGWFSHCLYDDSAGRRAVGKSRRGLAAVSGLSARLPDLPQKAEGEPHLSGLAGCDGGGAAHLSDYIRRASVCAALRPVGDASTLADADDAADGPICAALWDLCGDCRRRGGFWVVPMDQD